MVYFTNSSNILSLFSLSLSDQVKSSHPPNVRPTMWPREFESTCSSLSSSSQKSCTTNSGFCTAGGINQTPSRNLGRSHWPKSLTPKAIAEPSADNNTVCHSPASTYVYSAVWSKSEHWPKSSSPIATGDRVSLLIFDWSSADLTPERGKGIRQGLAQSTCNMALISKGQQGTP